MSVDIRRINDRLRPERRNGRGGPFGSGVGNLTATPNQAAFRRSGAELAELEWGDATVLVEHCDAVVGGQKPSKGFLNLEEEIAALLSVAGSQLRLSLNWRRYLIELRNVECVLDHVAAANTAGLLGVLTFSGASATGNGCGEARYFPPGPPAAPSTRCSTLIHRFSRGVSPNSFDTLPADR
jgi:Domain of unknown function (DUF4862)